MKKGKSPSKYIPEIGTKFSTLTVISESFIENKKRRVYCKCICGKELKIRVSSLLDKTTKNCGCLNKRNSTHNYAKHEDRSPEYTVWLNLRQRCSNPNNSEYHNYGGRGIKVCERWDSFDNFLKDMGFRPTKNHSINRSNNNGDYEPDNCFWSTKKEQDSNKRNNNYIEYNGRKLTVTQWAEILTIKPVTLFSRLKSMSIEKAFTKPIRR